MKKTKIAIVAKSSTGKIYALKILFRKRNLQILAVVINKDVQVVLFDQRFEVSTFCGRIHDDFNSKPIQALKIITNRFITDQKFIEKALQNGNLQRIEPK